MSPHASAQTSERKRLPEISSRDPNPRAPARNPSSTRPLSPMLARIITRVWGYALQMRATVSAQGTPWIEAPMRTTGGCTRRTRAHASSYVKATPTNSNSSQVARRDESPSTSSLSSSAMTTFRGSARSERWIPRSLGEFGSRSPLSDSPSLKKSIGKEITFDNRPLIAIPILSKTTECLQAMRTGEGRIPPARANAPHGRCRTGRKRDAEGGVVPRLCEARRPTAENRRSFHRRCGRRW